MKRKVLFLCTGNSCCSQMAEATISARLDDAWEAYSVGIQLAGYVHPLAIRTLAEIGIVCTRAVPSTPMNIARCCSAWWSPSAMQPQKRARYG